MSDVGRLEFRREGILSILSTFLGIVYIVSCCTGLVAFHSCASFDLYNYNYDIAWRIMQVCASPWVEFASVSLEPVADAVQRGRRMYSHRHALSLNLCPTRSHSMQYF